MADVGLMFVGAVLFVNGLLLLGKVDSQGSRHRSTCSSAPCRPRSRST